MAYNFNVSIPLQHALALFHAPDDMIPAILDAGSRQAFTAIVKAVKESQALGRIAPVTPERSLRSYSIDTPSTTVVADNDWEQLTMATEDSYASDKTISAVDDIGSTGGGEQTSIGLIAAEASEIAADEPATEMVRQSVLASPIAMEQPAADETRPIEQFVLTVRCYYEILAHKPYRDFTIIVHDGMEIRDLRRSIEKEEYIDWWRQRLIYGGVEIDEKTKITEVRYSSAYCRDGD